MLNAFESNYEFNVFSSTCRIVLHRHFLKLVVFFHLNMSIKLIVFSICCFVIKQANNLFSFKVVTHCIFFLFSLISHQWIMNLIQKKLFFIIKVYNYVMKWNEWVFLIRLVILVSQVTWNCLQTMQSLHSDPIKSPHIVQLNGSGLRQWLINI